MNRLFLLLISLLFIGNAYPSSTSTPPFNHGRYANPDFKKSWLDLVQYAWQRQPGEWHRNLALPPGPPPPRQVLGSALRVTVVNHATVLIQSGGINVLTDPIWSERASPVQWAGPRRFVPPGLRFEDLPPIHAVLISHNHYDHLDLPTLKRLNAAFQPLFVVGEREGDTLRAAGITHIAELGWGTQLGLPGGYAVSGLAAKHWTGRGALDRNQSLWLSYVLHAPGGPIYFAGDSGYGPQFSEAQQQFGPMRLALLPIGAYKPRWLTDFQHMSPCQAVQAHADLAARHSVAIHYGTFELADDGQTEPVTELARCLPNGAAPFMALPFGTGYDVPPL